MTLINLRNIQTRIDRERAEIFEVGRAAADDPRVRTSLQEISTLLDDAHNALRDTVQKPAASEHARASWLAFVEQMLATAVTKRKSLQALIARTAGSRS